MDTNERWMLYGAYGTTGRLILEDAMRRGHRPLLAGRDPARLSALAAKTCLEAVALSLDSPLSANKFACVSAVLNAAGPFFATGAPVRRLCLEAGVSYVDVNGEIDDFVDAMSGDSEARTKRIAIIPGAGFGVVFGEAVAAHAARRMPDATWLRISLATANASTSAGAELSTASVLAAGGCAVSDGRLRARPIAFTTWRIKSEGSARLRFAAAPRAELVAAHRLTGIPEIITGVPLSLPAGIVLRMAGRLVGAMLARIAAARPAKAPSPEQSNPQQLRSRVWAEAGNQAGQRVTSVLEAGEGYRLAAAAAVHAMERLLDKRPIGSLTPAQAFGADFALSLPVTRIYAL